ncbi:hypothetical protein U1738_19680 [Sphingomonas sp. GB1N7]
MSFATVLKEGLSLALVTVLLYLTAGAYSFGYQDQFGFTYLSLGVEDLVVTSRPMMIQFVLSVLSVTLAWAIFRGLVRRYAPSLVGTMYLLLPITLVVALLISSINLQDFSRLDHQTFWMLFGYYSFEILRLAIIRGYPIPMRQLADHLAQLRIIQMGTGAFLFLLLAFDLGVVDAIKQQSFDFCPRKDNADWVVVQLAGDIIVCAEADIGNKLIYRRFHYLKIKDGPDSIILENKGFAPRCIGMPKNLHDWNIFERSHCGSNRGQPKRPSDPRNSQGKTSI